MAKVKYFGVKFGKGYVEHAEQPRPNSQKHLLTLAGVIPFTEHSHFFHPFFADHLPPDHNSLFFFKSYSQGNTLRIGDLDIFSFGVMVLSLGTRRFPSQERLNL